MATVSSVSAPQVVRDLDKMAKIPLSHCMSLDDIEKAAERIIPRNAWTYFHSAADSLRSYDNNRDDWKKVMLRPRTMRNVQRVDMQRTMFGHKCQLPFFIAPAARAKVVHEDGELCLARGAAKYGIGYCPSTYSTIEHEDLAKAFTAEYEESKGGALFFQLYVAKKKERTIELITMARRLGFKALVVTVDSPVVGKREEDERYRAELSTAAGEDSALLEWMNPGKLQGEDAPVLRGHHSSTLNWDDLPWIKEAWGWPQTGPIALKGIQTAEDAALSAQYGIDAIYLSNHGGRQCDDAPSSIQTLLEIRRFYPEILRQMEIYLDGGIRRGADVLKALCLGATGVSLGRPFMYSVAYGDQGVERVINCKHF
jgi:L-lactate dehydrogenase (cytochrome)